MSLPLRCLLTAVGVCVSVHLYLESTRPHAPPRLPRPADGQKTLEKPDGRATTTDEDSASRRRHGKVHRWRIRLQPWAKQRPSLEEEAKRFLRYITTPQVSCTSPHVGPDGGWAVCLDPKYSLTHRMQRKQCRLYSFGLGADERKLETSLASSGCEVHCFDPSLKQPHQQNGQMWLHRISVDWRDPNPAALAQRHYTKKLANILNDFGHRQVDILKADMESAEWKILENLILEGVVDCVGQLLLEVHLHWAGFEVAGDEPSVVRFWFSLLKELEDANFRLFRVHSDSAQPRVFLHKNVLNASSAYTLAWVNTRWLDHL
ncbi:putative methyltransferase-like protein 24 [Festucalex cinctus]